VKINPQTLEVEIENDLNGASMEEIAEYMPESSPRYPFDFLTSLLFIRMNE